MDKPKKQAPSATENNPSVENDGNRTIVLQTQENEKLVVCDVCGFANPQYTAICKKCSNYLEK